MKTLILPLLLFVLAACATQESPLVVNKEISKKYPAVTIETSGDLYYEDGGNNIQMDIFGNCATGQAKIYIEIDNKKSVTDCKNGRYRYSMNLPKTFFDPAYSKKLRSLSAHYAMKEISAYHDGHKKLNATSYILIDRKKKEVKSVINKQVRFEKIPTGDYEPVTQYNAFGSCAQGTLITMDIKAPDRYGHERSKFDEKKSCQKTGGFYFLSQVHGFPKKGTMIYLYEDQKVPSSGRSPASKQPSFKNLLKWPVSISQD